MTINRPVLKICFFLLVVPSVFSGCRLGNHSDEVVQPPIFISQELFLTEPQSFVVSAGIDNGTPSTNTNSTTPLSAIPANILATFSNPHYFAVLNNQDRTQVFMDYNMTSLFQTTVAADGTIEYDSDEGQTVLYDSQFMYNPNCRTRVKVLIGGKLDRTKARNVALSGGGSLFVNGESKIDFNVSRAIYGDCQEDLEDLAYCYTNGAGCPNDLLQFAQDLLFLYVNRAGVLNVNDIVHLKSLEYTVHFE